MDDHAEAPSVPRAYNSSSLPGNEDDDTSRIKHPSRETWSRLATHTLIAREILRSAHKSNRASDNESKFARSLASTSAGDDNMFKGAEGGDHCAGVGAYTVSGRAPGRLNDNAYQHSSRADSIDGLPSPPSSRPNESLDEYEANHVSCLRSITGLRLSLCLTLIVLLILLAAVGIMVVTLMSDKTANTANIFTDKGANTSEGATPTPVHYCARNGTLLVETPKKIARTTRYKDLKAVLESVLNPTVFDEPCAPNDLALTWLSNEANLPFVSDAAIYQRFAVTLLYFSTKMQSTKLAAPLKKMNDTWLSVEGECLWHGISCANDPAVDTVVGIELADFGLEGSIPDGLVVLLPHLGKSKLKSQIIIPETWADHSFYKSPRLDVLETVPIQQLNSLLLFVLAYFLLLPFCISFIFGNHAASVDLSANRLTGTIPASLYGSPSLGKFHNDVFTY
eukprot:scaffold27164_cov35-Attheya_sp.AAC.1